MAWSQAVRRYSRRLTVSMVAYAIGLVVANWLERRYAPTGAWPYLLALLPALPMTGVVAAIGRYLAEEPDEYIRLQQVKASLIATGLLLVYSTTSGFMEDFAHLPHLRHASFPVWCFGLLAGQVALRVRR